ncbi:hypothetical protein GCM10023347_08890 [Streptomyces chumphonensis]|uniref:DUF4333 domain-containing protein n=1 Tax=Streptomyces chumphonensis TaxID=1214925 RepID=A0A927EZ15_9ACTN|nr:DUF4333 domain-containing protein [Streptomyces chumphonensis]MBD3932343.1 DUF4333 domain-containing protein [Streptomyces chumphonensis]
MRITKIAVAVVAAALLTAGCGSDDGGDGGGKKTTDSAANGAQRNDDGGAEGDGEGDGEFLAVEITEGRSEVVESNEDLKTPQPEPGSDADFTEKVEHRLRETLLRQAKVNGETSAECPDGVTLKASATSECTATYEGVEVPFEVTIKDDYEEGAFFIQYDADAKKDLLLAQGVYDAWWTRHGENATGEVEQKLTCDEIPPVQAVDRGADTGHRCQVWTKYGDTGEFSTFDVTTDSFGPQFTPVGG